MRKKCAAGPRACQAYERIKYLLHLRQGEGASPYCYCSWHLLDAKRPFLDEGSSLSFGHLPPFSAGHVVGWQHELQGRVQAT